MSLQRSVHGKISLYGPGWIWLSISGLRDALVTGETTKGLSAGNEVPFRKACPAFRGIRNEDVDDQSAHRGIVTAHSHCLYAVAHWSQFTAREYKFVEEVLLH